MNTPLNTAFITRHQISLQDMPADMTTSIFAPLGTLSFELGEIKSVFWYASRLHEFFISKLSFEKSIDDLNRAGLAYLDADVMRDMLGFAIEAREQVLILMKNQTLPAIVTSARDAIGSRADVDSEVLLRILHFSPEEISLLDEGVNIWVRGKEPEYQKKLKQLSVFYHHVRVISFFLGLDLSEDRYDVETCWGILGGAITNYDEAVLALSLKELLDYHDGIIFAKRVLLTQLSGLTLNQELSWFEALLRTIILHVTWNVFSILSPDEQSQLLQQQFVVASWVGVAVENYCADFVYDTNNVGAFAAAHKFLQDNLEKNSETIPTVGTVAAISYVDLVRRWLGQVKSENSLESDAAIFIEQYYGSQLFPDQKKSLARTLWTYGKIYRAELVESNRGGDGRAEERAVLKDLTQLVIWFVDVVDWPKIFDYFKQDVPVVSVLQFYRYLEENFSLPHETDGVEKVLQFTEALNQAGLVGTNFEPVLFSESNQEFTWNHDDLLE